MLPKDVVELFHMKLRDWNLMMDQSFRWCANVSLFEPIHLFKILGYIFTFNSSLRLFQVCVHLFRVLRNSQLPSMLFDQKIAGKFTDVKCHIN